MKLYHTKIYKNSSVGISHDPMDPSTGSWFFVIIPSDENTPDGSEVISQASEVPGRSGVWNGMGRKRWFWRWGENLGNTYGKHLGKQNVLTTHWNQIGHNKNRKKIGMIGSMGEFCQKDAPDLSWETSEYALETLRFTNEELRT